MELGGWVEQTVRKLRIVNVLVKRNGRYRPVGRKLTAPPRQLVKLRVLLRPSAGGPDRRIDFEVRMPGKMRHGALIEIGGGRSEGDCVECEEGEWTFDDLLESLRRTPRNNVLAARVLGVRGLAQKSVRKERLDQFVEGRRLILVTPTVPADG